MVRLLGVLSGTLLLMVAVAACDSPECIDGPAGTGCATPFQLTVSGEGSGEGTVTSVPDGINCSITAGSQSGACSAPFDSATVVTLSESSSSPSAFLGWSRDCTGEGACQVVMAGPSAVSARFETGDRTVTVEIVSGFGTGVVSAGGGISCIVDDGEVSGACAATLPVGTQMVMTAVATEANTAFDGWSGDVCTNDTGNCEFTLGEDVTVVAALPRKATVGIVGTPDVSFTANEGSNPPDQIKQFSNAGREGDRDLNFTTHSSESWLTVSPAEGSLFPGEIGNLVLRVQSASLAPGNYSAEVEIRDPEGSMSGGGSVPRVIDVTLRVN